MVEITVEEAKNYTSFYFKDESEFGKKFKSGPKFFCKIRKEGNWDEIRYFI